MPARIGLLLILFLAFAVPKASATHLYGADLFYEHVTGLRYKVTLVLYGDCEGQNFFSLDQATPQIIIYDDTTALDTIYITQNGPGEEVTPVCEREKNNTKCKNKSFPIPGVTRYTYSGYYTLPRASQNWRFCFIGPTTGPGSVTNYIAGRSNDIGNIPVGTVMALEARLNNISGANSSPRFTTIPTPFYCINIPQQYNHGAIDANNDSLDYAVVPGLFGNAPPGGFVTYNPTYSGTLPLGGDATGWSLSKTTGQLNFTPNVAKKYLVVNEVKEYRNGVVVGTSMREMSFIVLANCNTTPSISNLDTGRTFKSSVFMESDRVTICQTTDTARFAIVPTNRSGDTIDASVVGLPPGITAKVYSNSTPRPVIVLTWGKANLNPGLYNFFVTYRDHGCPLTSVVTKAFTVRVVAPNDITGPRILLPTLCFRKAVVEFSPILGLTPRTITISKGGVMLRTYRDSTGAPFLDSFFAGTYTIDMLSDDIGCPTQRQIVIVDSGEYPNIPTVDDRFHCLGDAVKQLTFRADSGGVVNWYLPNGTQLPEAPTPQTDVAGIWRYIVNQKVRVCVSKNDTVLVYVTKRPVAAISGDMLRCEMDTGTYVFSGSIGVGPILEYRWFWDKAYLRGGDGPGPWKAAWGLGGTKYITLQVLENKCPSDTTVFPVTVRPSPYSGFELPAEACQFEKVAVTYTMKPLDSQQYQWNFAGADPGSSTGEGPFTVQWNEPGLKRVSLNTERLGCRDERYKEILVHPSPDVHIMNVPETVCIGQKIYLEATGARSYTWYPEDSIRNDEYGIYAHILKPSRYKVIGKNEWSCQDSAFIDYAVVEDCCTFGYPNAFTPNGDGKNDKFNVVSYGFHRDYELSIYNRWGQRVFYGHETDAGWDGTFGGKVCDAGTYYYYFSALCYTGHREIKKGDVILIR